MICLRSVIFISFSIAASVVALPEPVGPVTSTKPFSRLTKSLNISGEFRSSSEGISSGITRKAAARSLL